MRNSICEGGYSEERADRPLQHAAGIVAAYGGEDLVALTLPNVVRHVEGKEIAKVVVVPGKLVNVVVK